MSEQRTVPVYGLTHQLTESDLLTLSGTRRFGQMGHVSKSIDVIATHVVDGEIARFGVSLLPGECTLDRDNRYRSSGGAMLAFETSARLARSESGQSRKRRVYVELYRDGQGRMWLGARESVRDVRQ